ncbi:MAG TPA: hypothetical protein PLL17_02175 [Defluviitaleaceae bacterium]|nr:hypothetical protein [Candidatus Epulonipiscium sp.]HOQ17118.1 hypothetical protein [Defluviitaleaceae bacterium]HPT76116.1 hypothetical protein [Defluviitaleaceae bacterium]HQD49926.1 hypothetical protein [Defluviitaleaceae bacterium]
MSEETRMILKMVDDGKITPEQAVEMLKAVGQTESDREENDFRGDDFIKDVEKWAKDFAAKMGNTVKDIEPKVKKIVKIMIQNTAKSIEEVGKVIKGQEEAFDDDNDNNADSDFNEDEYTPN